MKEPVLEMDVSYFSNKIKISKQKSEHNMDGKAKLSYCSFIVSVNIAIGFHRHGTFLSLWRICNCILTKGN